MTLRVGHIAYANCVPFFHYLSEMGFSGEICSGVPSDLNRMLSEGEIDISPSSSFEYGRNSNDYLILPQQSISSCGPVQSVLLFSQRRLEEIGSEKIFLTGESATSVALLEILLQEFLGVRELSCQVPEAPVEDYIADGKTALLIGDRALRVALGISGKGYLYDLGELWERFTGLPFVFALWIIRKDSALEKKEEVDALRLQLASSREKALSNLEALAEQTPEVSWMGKGSLVEYWSCMSYDLTANHLKGLSLFFELCLKYELLERPVELKFFT